MACIRALFIFGGGEAGQWKILYSRRFSCVENLIKRLQNENYVPVPPNNEFLKYFASYFRLMPEPVQFIDERDSCIIPCTTPVHALPIGKDRTLPIVVHSKNNCFLGCLPFDDNCHEYNATAICSCSALPVAQSILCSIEQLLQLFDDDICFLESSKLQIDMFLCQAMPFGRPIDVDPLVTQSKLNTKATTALPTRQPAWKPAVHKGRSQVSLLITECVSCAQCDIPGSVNAMDVHGAVLCIAEIEGHSSEISLTLSNENSKQELGISNLMVHPCVSLVDPPIQHLDPEQVLFYKMRFMPPLERFILCQYMVPSFKEIPVFGVLKLRGDSVIDLLLQLKLNPKLKNSFEYFEVNIPFSSRGNIDSADLKPSWGMTHVSPEKNMIVWNLGNRFPSKTSEASLQANVYIIENGGPVENKPSTFAEIKFCIKSYAPSRTHIDSKTIHLFPAMKFKLSLEKEFKTSDYKIWNSYGEITPVSIPI